MLMRIFQANHLCPCYNYYIKNIYLQNSLVSPHAVVQLVPLLKDLPPSSQHSETLLAWIVILTSPQSSLK